MNELLASVKADLTDRRLLPLVGLVGALLIGAVAYAVLGGGGAKPSGPSPPSSASTVHGIAVTEAQTGSSQAVAETTGGTSTQHQGSSRDPFTPLAGTSAKTAAAASAATSKSTAASGSGSSGGSTSASTPASKPSTPSTSSGGGSETKAPSKPATPAKPKTVYAVALEFGVLPLAPGQTLQSYVGLTKATPLPAKANKVVELIGVTSTKSGLLATFSLAEEVILHGAATCLPSPEQCKLLELAKGRAEQLEVLVGGQVVTYELKVVTIDKANASSAKVASVLNAQRTLAAHESSVGGSLALAGIRFAGPGLLVFVHHSASTARAHGAAAHHR